MSDNYQAIYDAVRSRIGGANISDAIQSAIRDAGLVDCVERSGVAIVEATQSVAETLSRPSAVYRPRIYMDGNQWCALYGENLQDGVAGFGNSPEEAMSDFDVNWSKKLNGKNHSNALHSNTLDTIMKREQWPFKISP